MSGEIGFVSATVWAIAAGAMSALIIVILYPFLKRYALAKPTSRSSHRTPTPQGGGIAVVAATLLASFGAVSLPLSGASAAEPPLSVFAAVILIACVGAADDIRSIAVVPRLILQAAAVALVIFALPQELRLLQSLPLWAERILLAVGGLWFVNLVNFMDGLDLMTVVEFVPVTAALSVIGFFGVLPPEATAAAISLCGAMIAFAYFNRPVARLFLGDVGSLAIGLLLGWLLLLLAASGHIVAAIILPLYYLADATITLLRRFVRREPVWQAHRTHFYQLATDRGFTVTQVVTRVFFVNVVLAALAMWTVIAPSRFSVSAALLGGAVLVTLLLFTFARGRR